MDKSNRCQNPITNETLKAPDFSIFPMPHSTPMNTNNLKTFQIHNFALKKTKKKERGKDGKNMIRAPHLCELRMKFNDWSGAAEPLIVWLGLA